MANEIAKLVGEALDRNEAILFQALDGLDVKALHERVGPDANHVAWLLWHLSRTQDNHRSGMDGNEHVYLAEGWAQRFGREPDRSDRGRGHTSEQVGAFRADLDTLRGYYNAVRAKTNEFLGGLNDEDMGRQVPSVMGDGPVPHDRWHLEMLLVDNFQHAGQVAYLRGLIGGSGWLAS